MNPEENSQARGHLPGHPSLSLLTSLPSVLSLMNNHRTVIERPLGPLPPLPVPPVPPTHHHPSQSAPMPEWRRLARVPSGPGPFGSDGRVVRPLPLPGQLVTTSEPDLRDNAADHEIMRRSFSRFSRPNSRASGPRPMPLSRSSPQLSSTLADPPLVSSLGESATNGPPSVIDLITDSSVPQPVSSDPTESLPSFIRQLGSFASPNPTSRSRAPSSPYDTPFVIREIEALREAISRLTPLSDDVQLLAGQLNQQDTSWKETILKIEGILHDGIASFTSSLELLESEVRTRVTDTLGAHLDGMLDHRLTHVDTAIRQVTSEIAEIRFSDISARLDNRFSDLRRVVQSQVSASVTSYVEERLLELKSSIPKDYMTGEDIIRRVSSLEKATVDVHSLRSNVDDIENRLALMADRLHIMEKHSNSPHTHTHPTKPLEEPLPTNPIYGPSLNPSLYQNQDTGSDNFVPGILRPPRHSEQSPHHHYRHRTNGSPPSDSTPTEVSVPVSPHQGKGSCYKDR